MKKKVFDPWDQQLDAYEQEIEDSIDENNIVSVPNWEKRKKEIQASAAYTLKLMKKEKRISLRVNDDDLKKIRQKAADNGMPYQTLINTVLHQLAIGKLQIQL